MSKNKVYFFIGRGCDVTTSPVVFFNVLFYFSGKVLFENFCNMYDTAEWNRMNIFLSVKYI